MYRNQKGKKRNKYLCVNKKGNASMTIYVFNPNGLLYNAQC